jgi:predicted nucleic acid-binding protein
MGKRYLIDTNAIIDYTSGLFPNKGLSFVDDIINQEVNISVISKIEALAFEPQADKQKQYFQLLIDFISNANVYMLDDFIIEKTIEIRKAFKLKLPDAIIAATSVNNNLTLISRDVKDFGKVPKLKIINPYEL